MGEESMTRRRKNVCPKKSVNTEPKIEARRLMFDEDSVEIVGLRMLVGKARSPSFLAFPDLLHTKGMWTTRQVQAIASIKCGTHICIQIANKHFTINLFQAEINLEICTASVFPISVDANSLHSSQKQCDYP